MPKDVLTKEFKLFVYWIINQNITLWIIVHINKQVL